MFTGLVTRISGSAFRGLRARSLIAVLAVVCGVIASINVVWAGLPPKGAVPFYPSAPAGQRRVGAVPPRPVDDLQRPDLELPSKPESPTDVLYDQYNNAGTDDVTSQMFEPAYSAYTAQAADDFQVPAWQT